MMPQVFAAIGVNAVWLPFEGGADLLPLMLDALTKMRNLGGFTVTIPHKTAHARPAGPRHAPRDGGRQRQPGAPRPRRRAGRRQCRRRRLRARAGGAGPSREGRQRLAGRPRRRRRRHRRRALRGRRRPPAGHRDPGSARRQGDRPAAEPLSRRAGGRGRRHRPRAFTSRSTRRRSACVPAIRCPSIP